MPALAHAHAHAHAHGCFLLQLADASESLADHSAEPIMLNHVINMVRGYATPANPEVRPSFTPSMQTSAASYKDIRSLNG